VQTLAFEAAEINSGAVAISKLLSGHGRMTGKPEVIPGKPDRYYFRIADHPPGISVSLQVEHKQFIGNGQLIGSSLR
jgi:hypothetical protein